MFGEDMKLNYRLIREHLKNVYFITGTAAAGKSTASKILSKKYIYILFGENENIGFYMKLTNRKTHPNLHYFNTMTSWTEFVMRDFNVYENWLIGLADEITPLQILDLIQISKDQPVIAETNMSIDVLEKISEKSRIAIMLTTPDISKEVFFNREDQDKNFILNVLHQTKNSKKNIERYKNLIRYLNREEQIKSYIDSGLFFTFRSSLNDDVMDRVSEIEEHFRLK
jgi:hypothetical protein